MNSEKNNDVKKDEGSTKSPSYLPDWLLDMKKNISDSKQLYSQTNQRIEGLKFRVESLGERIGEVKSQKEVQIVKQTNHFLIHDLPIDTIIIVVRFLDPKSLVIFENVSKLVKQFVNSSELWNSYFKDLYPDIPLRHLNQSRAIIIKQAQFGVNGIKFIRLMNSNKTLAHSRSFESYSKDRHTNKIETMTKDFRTFTLMSLRALNFITCHENSSIHRELLQVGVIRVLTSLLSNESCLVQQYSCDIISNMLSWEALLIRKNESDCKTQTQTQAQQQVVSNELQICDGRRQLLSLLTSPSATVVLSTY